MVSRSGTQDTPPRTTALAALGAFLLVLGFCLPIGQTFRGEASTTIWIWNSWNAPLPLGTWVQILAPLVTGLCLLSGLLVFKRRNHGILVAAVATSMWLLSTLDRNTFSTTLLSFDTTGERTRSHLVAMLALAVVLGLAGSRARLARMRMGKYAQGMAGVLLLPFAIASVLLTWRGAAMAEPGYELHQDLVSSSMLFCALLFTYTAACLLGWTRLGKSRTWSRLTFWLGGLQATGLAWGFLLFGALKHWTHISFLLLYLRHGTIAAGYLLVLFTGTSIALWKLGSRPPASSAEELEVVRR